MAGNFNGVAEFEKLYQGEYYIHRHASHFYKAGNSPIGMFRESRNTFYDQMLSRYEEHFNASVDREAWEAVANSMEGEVWESEIIKTIENITLTKLEDGMKKVATESTNLLTALNTVRQISAKELINENNIEVINTLIEQVVIAASVLEEGERKIGGPALTAILKDFLDGTSDTKGNINKLKQRLGTKVRVMSKKQKILTVQEDAIRSIANSLNGILRRTGQKRLKDTSLSSYLSNIFSTRTGEYLVSKGLLKGVAEFNDAITKSLVGAKNVKLTKSEELEFAKQFGQMGGTKHKTDNKFDKFSIEFGEDKDSFNINVGISTKWYKGDLNKEGFSVSLGGESKFENKLDQTLHAANISKYYAYNAIALKNQNPEGYDALLQMILTRNADVFISGLGIGGDFSQFLFINGKFFSIYNILLNLLKVRDTVANNPVEIKLEDDSTLNKISGESDNARKYTPNWMAAFFRSRKQNHMFKQLGLSLHFYPRRLENLT